MSDDRRTAMFEILAEIDPQEDRPADLEAFPTDESRHTEILQRLLALLIVGIEELHDEVRQLKEIYEARV